MRTVRRVPVITAVAVCVAVAAAIVQYAAPAVVPVLRRDQDVLAAGEWWRLVTPLFVQTLGWHQVVTNLVTLVLVGVVAERLLGRWRWAALLAAGTVGGQAAAYAWHMYGGGDSIAICGLAGGVVVWLLTGRAQASRWEVGVVVCYVAALTGWGFGGLRVAAMVLVVAALLSYAAPRAALLAAVACAVALTGAADLHGVSLLSGMVTALALVGRAGAAVRPELATRRA